MTAKRRGPRSWDAEAFDKFLTSGRAKESAAGTKRPDRIFVNRKIGAAADVSVETLRKWRIPGWVVPSVDEYERLLDYFGLPDGTWLKQ